MSAEAPKRRKPNHTFDSSNTRHNIKRMLDALTEPMTYEQLAATLHMSDRSVRFYVQHLRQEPNKRVYLKEHLPASNGYMAQFALGSLPDAPRPARQSERERNAKYRAKVRSNPELRERRRQREKAQWIVKKAKRVPQNPFSALFMGGRHA